MIFFFISELFPFVLYDKPLLDDAQYDSISYGTCLFVLCSFVNHDAFLYDEVIY